MEGRFADFDLGRRLGGGSFGEVHAAYDRVQKARVALKKLRHADALDLYRFKKEFRALADIFHPNLVRLHELFEDKEQWYIAMELVDGVDLVSYARQDPLLALAPTVMAPVLHGAAEPSAVSEELNLERLRASFTQLAAGVDALHGAKRLHRDLKPSNVLVAADGTVKILDFGLVTELTDAAGSLGQMVGTPAYMAPEQARGDEVTPAADWYAVGVLLYETLLGHLPFDGEPLEIVAAKQAKDPTHPRAYDRLLPADLSDLCMQLLHRDPGSRPAAGEVFELLNAGRPARRISSPPPKTLLVGREAELKALRDAFDESRNGAVVVHVAGPSGNGKTSLLRAFAESLSEAGGAAVLEGRCYEGEGVPFKAVDTVMDATATRLVRAPTAEIDRILPRDFEPLTRLFPVLKRLVGSSRYGPQGRELHDPIEIRRRGFAALRDLVGRVAERLHVVICIDDFQWGDLDSVALLADLVRPPDAPPILLVLSYRSEESEASAVLRALQENVAGEASVTIDVGPLTHADSVTLAQAILQEGTAAEGDLDAIARESGGSPLFVKELARHVLDGARSTDDVTIDDLIAQRLERLLVEPRAMLEIIAVAANAVSLGIIRSVAGLSGEQALSAFAVLKSEHLARVRRQGEEDVIEAYHDRIRERVRALLAPDKARRWHGMLAAALETVADADPERIAIHYHASHTPERARPHAERAALAASAALAFDRGATLWRMVVDLVPPEAADALRVRVQLGDALVRAGRGAEAAEVYLEGSKRAEGAARLDLWRRSSEQFLYSGQIGRGMEWMSRVLAKAGFSLRSPRLTIVLLVLTHVWIRARGLKCRVRSVADLPSEALARLDACVSAAMGLVMIDSIQSMMFVARALRLALRLGEPFRLSLAMTGYANFELFVVGASAHTALLQAEARRLATDARSDGALAFSETGAGVASAIAGDWSLAVTHSESALSRFQESATPDSFSRKASHISHATALFAELISGRYRQLVERHGRLRRDATERGNLLFERSVEVGTGGWADLVRGDVTGLRRRVDPASTRWKGIECLARADLYEGNPQDAVDRLEPVWERLTATGAMVDVMLAWRARLLRAHAHLASPTARSDPKHRRIARTELRSLTRYRARWLRALIDVYTGALAATRGDLTAWRRSLERGVVRFDELNMAGYASAARYRLGALVGGDNGRTLMGQGVTRLKESGVRKPTQFIAILLPDPPLRRAPWSP